MTKTTTENIVECDNVIPGERVAKERADRKTPLASQKEIDLLFNTPEAIRTLAVQIDIASAGALIREVRRSLSFTQAQLAQQSKISRATIASIEAGVLEDGPRLGTLAALLRACGHKLVLSAEYDGSTTHDLHPVTNKLGKSHEPHQPTSTASVVIRYPNAGGDTDRGSSVSRGTVCRPTRQRRRT